MKESFRTHDGRRLTFRREGSGPLLVCHPGGPGFSSRYLADLGGLGSTRTLVMLDPRGTADSDAPQDSRDRLRDYQRQAQKQKVPVYWTEDEAADHRVRALCHLVLTLPEYQLS